MDGETRGKKMNQKAIMGIILILIGAVIGVVIYPSIEPFVQPERANALNQSQAIQAQNTLLKGQVDCLVNGILQGNSESVIENCT